MPPRMRLPQPMTVFGQVELAGASRYRAAIFDRVQEITVLQRLQKLRADIVDLGTTLQQVADQRVEPAAIDARLALISLQHAELMIEFLVDLAADIAARQDGHDLEKTRNRGPGCPVALELAVVKHLLVEELEAQESPHAFRDGLLVIGSIDLLCDVGCGFRHGGILRLRPRARK